MSNPWAICLHLHDSSEAPRSRLGVLESRIQNRDSSIPSNQPDERRGEGLATVVDGRRHRRLRGDAHPGRLHRLALRTGHRVHRLSVHHLNDTIDDRMIG